jgi:molybdate transport system substrate-binding protein
MVATPRRYTPPYTSVRRRCSPRSSQAGFPHARFPHARFRPSPPAGLDPCGRRLRGSPLHACSVGADGRRGSSGNFFAQLLQDAPFELFLSADEGYVTKLADAGKTLDRGRLYARGRICLVAPHGSPLKVDAELRDLTRAVGDGRVQRFAIANPEHAPYGRCAEQALRHAGLWDAIRPRLVLGENVSQAAQFATSGGAQGGIVALSLAKAPSFAALGTHAAIPEAWHAPLLQRMVLLKRASATARAFYEHLSTPAVQAVLARHGFAPPRG